MCEEELAHEQYLNSVHGRIWAKHTRITPEGVLARFWSCPLNGSGAALLTSPFQAVAFSGDGHTCAAADQQGRLYILYLRLNRFTLVDAKACGASPGAVCFTARCPEEVLCASASTLHAFDVETHRSCAVLCAHRRDVVAIRCSGATCQAFTQSSDATIVWDMCTWRQIHCLDARAEPMCGLALAPGGGRCGVLFGGKRISFWSTDSFSFVREVNVEEDGLLDFSMSSRHVAAVGKCKYIFAWSLASEERPALAMSIPCPAVELRLGKLRHAEGSRNTTSIAAFVLLADGEFIVALLQSLRIVLRIRPSGQTFTGFELSNRSRHLLFMTANGCLELRDVGRSLERERNSLNQSSRLQPWQFASKVVKRQPSTCSDSFRPPRPLVESEGGCKGIDAKSGLRCASLRKVPEIASRGKVWQNALALPRDAASFEALNAEGTHLKFLALRETHPSHRPRTIKELAAVLSALVRYSSDWAEISFLPGVVFPFLKVFNRDPVLTFEAVAFFLRNWAKGWISALPNEPFDELCGMEILLKAADFELHEHLRIICLSTSEVSRSATDGSSDVHLLILWPLLQTLLTEVLPKATWLGLWDRLVAQWREPELLAIAVVAFLRISRHALLALPSRSRCLLQEWLCHPKEVSLSSLLEEMHLLKMGAAPSIVRSMPVDATVAINDSGKATCDIDATTVDANATSSVDRRIAEGLSGTSVMVPTGSGSMKRYFGSGDPTKGSGLDAVQSHWHRDLLVKDTQMEHAATAVVGRTEELPTSSLRSKPSKGPLPRSSSPQPQVLEQALGLASVPSLQKHAMPCPDSKVSSSLCHGPGAPASLLTETVSQASCKVSARRWQSTSRKRRAQLNELVAEHDRLLQAQMGVDLLSEEDARLGDAREEQFRSEDIQNRIKPDEADEFFEARRCADDRITKRRLDEVRQLYEKAETLLGEQQIMREAEQQRIVAELKQRHRDRAYEVEQRMREEALLNLEVSGAHRFSESLQRRRGDESRRSMRVHVDLRERERELRDEIQEQKWRMEDEHERMCLRTQREARIQLEQHGAKHRLQREVEMQLHLEDLDREITIANVERERIVRKAEADAAAASVEGTEHRQRPKVTKTEFGTEAGREESEAREVQRLRQHVEARTMDLCDAMSRPQFDSARSSAQRKKEGDIEGSSVLRTLPGASSNSNGTTAARVPVAHATLVASGEEGLVEVCGESRLGSRPSPRVCWLGADVLPDRGTTPLEDLIRLRESELETLWREFETEAGPCPYVSAVRPFAGSGSSEFAGNWEDGSSDSSFPDGCRQPSESEDEIQVATATSERIDGG